MLQIFTALLADKQPSMEDVAAARLAILNNTDIYMPDDDVASQLLTTKLNVRGKTTGLSI